MTDKFKAIQKLCPNAKFGVMNDEIIWDDKEIKQPTDKEINDKVAELQAEYDEQQYQRDRAVAYPSIPDQLDTIYHQGIDAWKAEIKAVKDAHPKP